MDKIIIEVYGTNCVKCKKTKELFLRAIEEMAVDAEVKHITEINAIIDKGILTTPAVFVNGKRLIEGFVPTYPSVKAIIEKERHV